MKRRTTPKRMRTGFLAAWSAIAVLLLGVSSAAVRAEPQAVGLELAFVVDASGSIDEAETKLQRQGYLEALVNDRVLSAITGGLHGSIAAAYIEFAADGCARLSVPWTRIHDKASAKAFGEQILQQPQLFCPGGNAISEALTFAAESMGANAFRGVRRVIDISGDGPNTLGGPVRIARDFIVAQGIVINGLVIERPSMPDLDVYYRNAVTGGPGSFVIKAENRSTFAQAILKKMILEIAQKPAD
ncbi:MAG: DUF1194 domain-containing protein [Alphaproteobacteria bacterium]|nr:DUF1194 domain-containing protein [Alphaproteobacteria bacterium]